MAFNLQSFTGFKVDIVSSTVPQKTPTVLYGYPLQFLPSHLSLVLQIYHKFVIYQINCRKIKKEVENIIYIMRTTNKSLAPVLQINEHSASKES